MRQKVRPMHNFNASDFVALSPAKAKGQALAMFSAAQLDAMPDWQTVAYALHSVVTRKRASKAESEIAMQDAADASEFAPWADYDPKGKATQILRGRVAVEFADGWTKTVGVLSAKGKPWSIAKAVIFAVACYQSAAARRATGSDAILYCGDRFLSGLISVPEIVSVISADSDETVAGDLVWNPCDANAATRERRAGRVDLADPTTYATPAFGEGNALLIAAHEIARAMGLRKTPAEQHMMRENMAAAARVEALFFPWDRGRDAGRYDEMNGRLNALMDADPEGFVYSRVALSEFHAKAQCLTVSEGIRIKAGEIAGPDDAVAAYGAPYSLATYADRIGAIEDALLAWPAKAEADPRADLAPADHETMLIAGEIVGDIADADAFADSLCLPYVARFTLVEDALLAWPALVEPCVAIDGVPVEIVASQDDAVCALVEPEAAAEPQSEPLAAIEASPAPIAAVEPAAPARKPRYSIGADGKWTLVAPAA